MALTQKDLQLIKETLQPEFNTLGNRISGIDVRIDKLEKNMTSLKRQNRKDHNSIINILDRADIKLGKRVTRIENHLGLPPFNPTL